MRLLFWRKAKPETGQRPTAIVSEGSRTQKHAKQSTAGPPSQTLAFARMYLLAQGARLNAETATSITATLSSGEVTHYTTSPADSRVEAGAPSAVLSPGGAALNAMLDDVSARAQVVSLRLSAGLDADTLARRTFVAPAKGCGRCLSGDRDALEACEICPLLEGKYVLRGLERITSTAILRQWEENSTELAFSITARDHFGRIDDLARQALDTSGAVLPQLRDSDLDRAEECSAPRGAESQLQAAISSAKVEMERRGQAVAAFLRLRGSANYSRRREEIVGAFTALQAEPDTDRAGAARALKGELARLADIFGAEVEVRLASAVFIRSTLAAIEVKDAAHHTLHATLDLGRGLIRSCTWEAAADSAALPASAFIAGEHVKEHAGLTVEALDMLPPATFAECLRWLLERTGVTVESLSESDASLRFRGQRGERPLEALVLRPVRHWPLEARDVRRASALFASSRAVSLLIGTALATASAREEALRLGVELWDRARLDEVLAEQSASYERDARERTADIEARVAIAVAIRTLALDTVMAMEAALTEAHATEKLRTQAKVMRAVATIEQGRLTTQRSLLACQTLLADLRAAFGARPARDGSLAIAATASALAELRERIEHLKPLAIATVREIANQPSTGDFGFSAWRRAVVEELTARCESLRWLTLALDPAQWRDYGKAIDAQAASQAAVSTSTADRAAIRVAQLASDFATRVAPLA